MTFQADILVGTTGSRGFGGRGMSRRDVVNTGVAASTALWSGSRAAFARQWTPVAGLSAEERGWLERASRVDHNGWVHVRIAREPFARGFQHGYLTAAEYADAVRVYEAMTYQAIWEEGYLYSRPCQPWTLFDGRSV